MSKLIPTTDKLKSIAYDSFVTTCGAVAVAYGIKKTTGKNLGVPMSLEGGAMLMDAIAGGTNLVHMIKKYESRDN